MYKQSSESLSKSSKSSKTSVSSDSLPKDDSKSSREEEILTHYEMIPEENEELEAEKLPPKSGEYYYQDYNYVTPTQSDFDRKQVQDSKLFDKTKKIVKEVDQDLIKEIEPFQDASILISGFGMRNVKSFQNLIKMSQEERKKWELRKLWRDKQARESIERARGRKEKAAAAATARSDITDISTSTTSSGRSSSDFLTQTDTAIKLSETSEQRKRLEYLMGLESEQEEKPDVDFTVAEEESKDEFKYSSSKSIREAQRYLRVHRVFECFQFIIAHLLSANAENPIEFILNLLNKCLLFRSGLGEPPLLYEKKHIGQLFHLMDRLETGLIAFPQYKTGMNTLGICTYNENPDVNSEDLISKEIFIEEAYEAELAIFNEFIKKRSEKSKKTEKLVPSMFESVSVPSLNSPLFIPSELLRFGKPRIDSVQDYFEG